MDNQLKSLALSQAFTLSSGSIVELTAAEIASIVSRAANDNLLAPGFTIDGKYRIVSVLGAGGMGTVYLAQHLLLNKKVALKTINSNQLSLAAIERFEREVKAVAALQNLHVIQIFDFGLGQDNKPYYTMELLSGQSLADTIDAQGPMGLEKVLPIFAQASTALLSAHKKGIIHRDLKPGNIFLHQENGQTTVKLVDFGIAKLLDSKSLDGQKLTTTGTIFGSPLYMSPEQSLGETVDARSDIYSLGCTLTECLTGKPPFVGPNAFATICLHQNGPIPRLTDLAPDLTFPTWLEALIERMLTKDPAERIQSCEEVLDVLLFQQSKKRRSESTANNIIRISSEPDDETTEHEAPSQRKKSVLLITALTALIALPVIELSWQVINQEEQKQQKLNQPILGSKTKKPVLGLATDLNSFPTPETQSPDLEKDFPDTATQEDNSNQPAEGLLKTRMVKQFKTVTRADFQTIVNYNVRVAELDGSTINNKDFELLKHSHLQKLTLRRTNVDDTGVAYITKCPTLSFLRVAQTKVSGVGLLAIAKMPTLLKLYVDELALDKNVLKALGKNRTLIALGLRTCRGLNYANLAALQGSHMTELDLQETGIDDQALKAISNFPGLATINLNRTKVTAAGVESLCKRVPTITEVMLAECSEISPAQVAKLKNQFRHITFDTKIEIEFDVLWENPRRR